MDFDNPKVYGDTFISDGLVAYTNSLMRLTQPLYIEANNVTFRAGWYIGTVLILNLASAATPRHSMLLDRPHQRHDCV